MRGALPPAARRWQLLRDDADAEGLADVRAHARGAGRRLEVARLVTERVRLAVEEDTYRGVDALGRLAALLADHRGAGGRALRRAGEDAARRRGLSLRLHAHAARH